MAKPSPEQLLIGAHCSTAGGLENALFEGVEIGATTVQLFTSNQRQWKGREVTEAMAQSFIETRKETGLSHIMSHGSYLINLGSPKADLRAKSQSAFEQEIKRCHKLEIDFLNFHPGAATSASAEQCLEAIVKSLKRCAALCENGKTRLLLETTAGQGTSVGHDFAHLATIIQEVKDRVPIGVCIDTCHIFAAGYDIRTPAAWDATLDEFHQVVGSKFLYAFHLNDSLHPLGARRDRHAHLGEGKIGMGAFRYMMQHPRMRALPKYLETPKGPAFWKNEIALLRKMAT